MKLLVVLLLLSLSSSLAFAQSEECLVGVKDLLKEKTEHYVFEQHPSLNLFIMCERYSLGAEVVVHEGVHFEDLGVPAGLSDEEAIKWIEGNTSIKVNLLALNGKKIGTVEMDNAPAPQKLVRNFLESKYPEVLNNQEHALQSWLEAYLFDDITLAATSFPNGLTELNAYNHGLIIEHRLNSALPEGHLYKGMLGQRQGVLHFLFLLKAYLHELKGSYPYKWLDMLTAHNKFVIKSLVKDARTALVSSQHCQLKDLGERQLFELLRDSQYFEAMKEVLEDESDLNQILCLK